MAKISLFFCFFVFVLVAMPTPSSSRMILENNTCPTSSRATQSCRRVVCQKQVFCTANFLICPDGQYNFKPCCGCQRCCPL
ncbi:hypothetical protein MKW94_010632 [Papaver nudicaule]|uniref:Uncharacterized protein n=1 Tax=Papaver nudicaule TaxID=74823 RepID=A0AA41SEM7_PAPNU|nr:hypothetical protein [Papaver nudicaule]